MGRLFCYTLSARAIGATVSAGALHAQGWGFESLIAHHLFLLGSRRRGPFLLGPSAWDSNPTGCGAEETRKRFPAKHARSEATKRKRAAKCVLGECPCAKNAKYEYCYHFSSRGFKAQRANRTLKRRPTAQMGRITDCNTGHLWFN